MEKIIPENSIGVHVEYRDDGTVALVFDPDKDYGLSKKKRTYTIASTHSRFINIPTLESKNSSFGLPESRMLSIQLHVCEPVNQRDAWKRERFRNENGDTDETKIG